VFCHINGEQIPVKVIVSSFTQEDNRKFFLANVIDISRHKKTEEALKNSRLFLMSSIESHKDTIIFSVDKDYHYLHFNKAHRDAMNFAYNKDIEEGMNFLECISSDDDRKLIKKNLDGALRGESRSIIQTFGKVNLAYYEVFFNPIMNEKGDIIGCTGLARNITERMQAEQLLKDSEIKFKEIINQINDVIIVFDEQGRIIIWNKGAEHICGLKAEDVLNKSIIDVQLQLTAPPFNDRSLIEKGINSILTQENPEIFNQIIDSEIIPSGSDKPRNIQSMVFPIRLNGDQLFCTVIRDTTEIKRYEKELLRISAEKDKFYSMIAQYLYTPFNVFNNFSQLMAEELDNLPIREIQKMARMMSKSANNLYSLLDNLLQWTRMNQGKIPFEPQKLNLKKISQDAVSILKPDDKTKEFKINHFIEDEIGVFADSFMVKTILRNLVSSAIKFSDNDGQIDIYAQETSSNVIISVRDNGMSKSPEYLARLFDISQIHTTLGSTEEKGTTLGLLLCKEFVEKHDGKIWVESKKNKGNEFKFTLPLLPEKRYMNK
jgi:PAS domain S-box-containing protein